MRGWLEASQDIAMPGPCTASSQAFSVKAFRGSDHVTRNVLAAQNNEAQGQDNGCYNWMSSPGRELGIRVTAFAFSRRFFLKVTVDFSMGKIILEVVYLKVWSMKC